MNSARDNNQAGELALQLSFLVDADSTAVLELKLGQYIVGERGPIGPQGPAGPAGTLTPEDMAVIYNATSTAQTAAGQATGSAQSATASAAQAQSALSLAQGAQQAAQGSAATAGQQAVLAGNSATSAATQAGNSATQANIAHDWALAAQGFQQTASAAATTATQQATAAGTAATAAQTAQTGAVAAQGAAGSSAAAAALSAQQAADSALAVNPDLFVQKTGGIMTGPLTMRNANVMFQNPAANWWGYLGPYGTPGAAGSGLGFVDSSLTYWNFQVENNGNTNTRGNATISGGARIDGGRLQLRQPAGPTAWGEMALYSSNGTVMFMRGRGTEGGGMQWINNNYDLISADMDNVGNLRLNGLLAVGNGSASFGSDGNIVGPLFPGGIHSSVADLQNNKADRYAWCVHTTATVEGGSLDTAGAGGSVIMGSPYLVVGMMMTWTTMHVFVNILRNN